MKVCAFEYLKIVIFLIAIIIVIGVLLLIPYIFAYRTFRRDPRGSGKSRMEISYYVVSILFIIFEIEFIILIP